MLQVGRGCGRPRRTRRRASGRATAGCAAILGLLLLLGFRTKSAAQPAPSASAPEPPAPAPATSEPPPSPETVRLEVVRAPGAEACPEAGYIENEITTMLGGKGRLFSDGARARFVVTLAPDDRPSMYRGRAELYGEGGALEYDREMRSMRDCKVLATALSLAFAIRWNEVSRAGQAPSPVPTPLPSAASVPPRWSPPPVLRPVCKLWIGNYCVVMDIYSFGLTAGALMTANYTADVGPGAYLGAEIRPMERFSFELQFRGIFPGRVVAAEPIDPTKPYETPKEPDVSSVAMLLVPCYRYSIFMGCGVAQFGILAFNTPIVTTTGQSIALGPRLGVEIPFLERFAVRVWGDALFHIPPVTYGLENINLKWTESIVAGLFGAGLVVNFK